MNFVSKVAVAAAVLVASPYAATAPAFAQKKAELKVSPAFRKVAGEVEALMKAANWQAASAKAEEAAGVAKTDDERYYVSNFRLSIAANLKDNPSTLRALDELIANPRTPPADLARYNFFRGDITLSEKKPAEALPYLLKAREGGYAPNGSNLNLLIARAQLDTNQLDQGIVSIDAAIKDEEAAGRKAPESWYQFAVNRLYTGGKKAEASVWLGRQLAAYSSPSAWRGALLIYMEQLREKGVETDADLQLDVYRLMRAAGGLAGEFDYREYADVAQRRGLPWEAKAVIDEGRAAGKLSTTSAAINDLYRSANVRLAAEGSLAAEEKAALANAKGIAAKNVGDAYLGSGNNAKAAELYRAALAKGGVDTNLVNTRLGIALAKAGQKDDAKAAFAQVTGAPRDQIARFWTTWLDATAN